jgi:very-short-patch-repair endonuclease
MIKYNNSYDTLSDEKKKEVIEKLYLQENKSLSDIAKVYNTYPNKIRRDAKSFNIPLRNKSEAQKNALNIGNHKHPTKGTKRPQETKDKIGAKVLDNWSNLTDAELASRKEKAKQNWEAMSTDQRANMLHSANTAVRLTSKIGSKLEKYILEFLLNNNIKVDFHKEQTLSNTKLQIDLFLPMINTAIEIDGPSHFLPVWGDDTLKKNIVYDNKKQGLILGRGWVLIRIKQQKDFSKSRAKIIAEKLLPILEQINTKFPEPDDRLFNIED